MNVWRINSYLRQSLSMECVVVDGIQDVRDHGEDIAQDKDDHDNHEHYGQILLFALLQSLPGFLWKECKLWHVCMLVICFVRDTIESWCAEPHQLIRFFCEKLSKIDRLRTWGHYGGRERLQSSSSFHPRNQSQILISWQTNLNMWCQCEL